MPLKRFTDDSDDDEFETEALQFLNKQKDETNKDEQDSDDNLLGEDDEESEEELERKEDSASNDSDDEAPEAITFSDGRQNIMTQLKSAMKQVDQEKQKLKEKRKRKEVQFKEQKEKKMKYMEETKLPDEILENIDDVIPKKIKNRKPQDHIENRKPQDQIKTMKAPVQPKAIGKTGKRKGRGRKDKGKQIQMNEFKTDKYIPLVDDISGVEVTDVRNFEKQHKNLAQTAADFRNSRLYGGGVHRVSNKSRLRQSEKKRNRLRR